MSLVLDVADDELGQLGRVRNDIFQPVRADLFGGQLDGHGDGRELRRSLIRTRTNQERQRDQSYKAWTHR